MRLENVSGCYLNIMAYASNAFPFMLTDWAMEIPDIPANEIFDNDVLGWEYKSEEEFINVLRLLRKHLELYFLPELDRRSEIMDEIRVTTRNYIYMKENLDSIIPVYRKEWGVDNNNLRGQLEILA